MRLSIKSAVSWVLNLLKKLAPHLSSQQILSLIGDIIALLHSSLSKEHQRELAYTLSGLDPDRVGLEDKAADLLIQLGGGRVEDLILGDHQVEVPAAELPL